MYIRKQKQTYRYRKHSSRYSGEREKRIKLEVWDQDIQTSMYKLDIQQAYIAWHRNIAIISQ